MEYAKILKVIQYNLKYLDLSKLDLKDFKVYLTTIESNVYVANIWSKHDETLIFRFRLNEDLQPVDIRFNQRDVQFDIVEIQSILDFLNILENELLEIKNREAK